MEQSVEAGQPAEPLPPTRSPELKDLTVREADANDRSKRLRIRPANARDKLWAITLGMSAILVLLWAAQRNNWALDPRPPQGTGLVSYQHLDAVWKLCLLIALVAAALAIGVAGAKRSFGALMDQAATWGNFGTDRYLRVARRLRATPRPRDGRFLTFSIYVLAAATWVMLLLLVTKTGGLVSTPFIQIAVSAFAWELVLANHILKRTFIVATAGLFIALCVLVNPDVLPNDQHFRLGFVVLLTAINMSIQYVPLVLLRDDS